MKYGEAITEAMTWLGSQPDTLFLGQSVAYPGTVIYGTLEGVPMEKRIELPVFENVQVGLSTGLALQGFVPVSCFPRWPFLIDAASQIVNHLDRLPLYSRGGFKPKVIIRVGIPTDKPLNPAEQHLGDYSLAFRLMLLTVDVIKLPANPDGILEVYQKAYWRQDGRSTIVVEHTERYGN